MGAGKGERSTPGEEAAIIQQDTKLLLHECIERPAVAVGHSVLRSVDAAPDYVGQCHAQASPNPLDLVVDVAEEGSPVDARWLGLLPDRVAPVGGLKDAKVLDDECSVRELRWQAHDEGAEHVAAARGVLVRHKVAPCRVDIEVVQLRGERAGNLWHQLAVDLFKYTRRGGVEVKDGKGATLGLDLKGVADR